MPYPADGGAHLLETWRTRLLHPLTLSSGAALLRSGEFADAGRTAASLAGGLASSGETPADAPLKAALWDALREIRDDRFYTVDANVVDMGYVYDVRLRHGGDAEVLMTMPHRGRPRYRYLGNRVAERLAGVPGVRRVVITPVWNPPWTPHHMTDAGWHAMGLHDRAGE